METKFYFHWSPQAVFISLALDQLVTKHSEKQSRLFNNTPPFEYSCTTSLQLFQLLSKLHTLA